MSPDATHAAPFAEMALLLGITAAAGALATRLKQPVLIAYIVVGILVGPAVFGLVQAHDQIDLLAQIGVAVLLFLVGLKLDLQHVRHIGPVALATGLGQLAFTILFGFFIVQDIAVVIAMMALLHALAARRFAGEVAVVARDDGQGAALKRAGAPTVVYPFQDAVDFTVEHLAGLIRSEKETT
jgi:Kef-type K+ transport system membrane component KefB